MAHRNWLKSVAQLNLWAAKLTTLAKTAQQLELKDELISAADQLRRCADLAVLEAEQQIQKEKGS